MVVRGTGVFGTAQALLHNHQGCHLVKMSRWQVFTISHTSVTKRKKKANFSVQSGVFIKDLTQKLAVLDLVNWQPVRGSYRVRVFELFDHSDDTHGSTHSSREVLSTIKCGEWHHLADLFHYRRLCLHLEQCYNTLGKATCLSNSFQKAGLVTVSLCEIFLHSPLLPGQLCAWSKSLKMCYSFSL